MALITYKGCMNSYCLKNPYKSVRKAKQPTRKMDKVHEENYLAHIHKIFTASSKK